jgi:NAD(P)H-dependent FMN reductase
MFKLQVIIGSTRAGRNADPVCRWFVPVAQSHGAFEVEILDLRDWALPFFQETIATLKDFNDPTYSDPLVKRWNNKIKEADAYIIVTPEYNHSLPGVLKNAIDTVFCSYGFRHKPVAFVAYSLGVAAGARAVEHLNQIMTETEAVLVRTPTLIPFVANAFNAAGQPVNPALNVGLTVMLDDLAWLANALKVARVAGAPPPAVLRIRAGTAKA